MYLGIHDDKTYFNILGFVELAPEAMMIITKVCEEIRDADDHAQLTSSPSLAHSSGLTNLFSRGYVFVSVKSVLDNNLPLHE
jgi:hypothetical protein